MSKCLGEKCPNHCCSNKFKGLSSALINEDFSCSALKNGKCYIYDVRPDVCKLYPYYFDPFCGLCIDKNCPVNFSLNIPQGEIYAMLNNRINLHNKPHHFFYDGYDIDNQILSNIEHINAFLDEINEKLLNNKAKVILIPYFNGKIKQDGGISGTILTERFHFTCHTFCYKNTVFIDCYDKNNIEKELLKIITKYFNTENFDLCRDNYDKKGNFGKHVIIENTDQMDYNDAINLVNGILDRVEMTSICDMQVDYRDNNNFDILQPIAESHISIHKTEKNVDIDVFSCKSFNENKIIELLDSKPKSILLIPRGIYYK